MTFPRQRIVEERLPGQLKMGAQLSLSMAREASAEVVTIAPKYVAPGIWDIR